MHELTPAETPLGSLVSLPAPAISIMRISRAMGSDIAEQAPTPAVFFRRSAEGCGLTWKRSCSGWPLLVRVIWWILRARSEGQ